MEQNQNPGKLGKAAFVLGIIALVFSLSPFLSTWFIILNWLAIPIAGVGIILGVLAVVKKQQKAILGLALCVIAAIAYPLVLKTDYIQKKTVENAAEVAGAVVNMAGQHAQQSINNYGNYGLDD